MWQRTVHSKPTLTSSKDPIQKQKRRLVKDIGWTLKSSINDCSPEMNGTMPLSWTEGRPKKLQNRRMLTKRRGRDYGRNKMAEGGRNYEKQSSRRSCARVGGGGQNRSQAEEGQKKLKLFKDSRGEDCHLNQRPSRTSLLPLWIPLMTKVLSGKASTIEMWSKGLVGDAYLMSKQHVSFVSPTPHFSRFCLFYLFLTQIYASALQTLYIYLSNYFYLIVHFVWRSEAKWLWKSNSRKKCFVWVAFPVRRFPSFRMQNSLWVLN
jgi:hypothetical protein